MSTMYQTLGDTLQLGTASDVDMTGERHNVTTVLLRPQRVLRRNIRAPSRRRLDRRMIRHRDVTKIIRRRTTGRLIGLIMIV